ncbi:MAG: DUF2116 family Zn-ribbon domain-containing protein [Nitrosopumilus sp.]|uniref:DUF2116 family Zn-ribbon domain-containing protein n=1 Tax=Nitrosopumilus sp. TaxID=2024843 RepID=UPI00247E3C8F|nr:DUF2116 family Zn-ribbon domain-containing protein [Nitrosopumilus sp.]
MGKCHRCGKSFNGDEKFCHDKCRDEHILDIEKRIEEAVKNDSSHTRKISRGF